MFEILLEIQHDGEVNYKLYGEGELIRVLPKKELVEILIDEGWKIKKYKDGMNISWVWSGEHEKYKITMNDEIIHWSKNDYDRDMFIAELKSRMGPSK
jgi:hypothetical protein